MQKPVNISKGKSIFYCVVTFAFAICIVSLIAGIKLKNEPFRGFPLNSFLKIGLPGIPDWTGSKAGLKLGDNIVAVNGKKVTVFAEVHKIVTEVEIGTPISYTISRKENLIEIEVPTMHFRVYDFLVIFIIPFITGLILLIVGTVVYFLKPDTKVSWVFLSACFCFGLYIIISFDIQFGHFGLKRLYLLTFSFISACFMHFSFIFPEPARFIKKYSFMQWIPYFFSFIIALVLEITYKGNLYWHFITIALFYLVIGSAAVVIKAMYDYIKAVNVTRRQRAKVILFGTSLAFPIPAFFYFAPYIFSSFYGIPGPVTAIPVTIFPAAIAYAIVKHNLFDVDTIIRRTVGYFVVTAIVVGVYSLVSVTFNVFMGQYQVAQSRAFPILFTLGVILVFNPLRNRVQALVDRLFFRKEYDYGEIIDKIGGAITSLIDLGQILKCLTRTFIEDMFIDTTSVMLLNPEGTAYQVYLADGESQMDVEKIEFKRNESIIEIIEEERKKLTKNDVLEDPKFREVSKSCAANFEALHASLMFPLVFQDKVIGLLNLGEKKSGKFYNSEDIELLNTVSKQGAVAIENARLFQENLEKQRMEDELAIAHELQTSMLPAACPQIEGFEIAAFSASAREVGGDFYDFIEIGKDSVGFVIGDVTGKSVSGALVMSASRTLFRTLSEDELSVGESMIRANRRLKKDTQSGMFVALLYLVLNGKEKALNMCSAGQTQPIHFSAQTNEVRLVETEGDTFPLGILDDPDYQETKLQLEPGDKVVFYTDGIVEAMNEKEEIFGFERLQEVIQDARSLSAESLLQKIIDKANEFVGEAAQHDDLTIIVISVDK